MDQPKRPATMARLDFQFSARFGTATLLMIGLALVTGTAAEQAPFGAGAFQAKGFKLAEPYGPPHETQTKSQLEGGKALPLAGGKTLLSDGVTLQTFSLSNTLEMVVTTPQCLYDSVTHSVNSTSPLRVRTADGKFTIEGEGFLWQQTNSNLIISNKVRTVIEAKVLKSRATNHVDSQPGPVAGPIIILSSRFNYDADAGLGIWRDNVNVTGTNLSLTSSVLTASLPMNKRELRSLSAEHDVTLKYAGLEATAGRMDYATDTGSVRMSDHPTWRAEQREGWGDELILDQTNRVFQANGHACLKLAGQSLGDAGVLSLPNSSNSRSDHSTNRSVEIVCDRYEIRTNWAIFRQDVRLTEQVDREVRGQMSCERCMTVTFAGTNDLQEIVAEKNVVIQQEDKQPDQGFTNRFTGGTAVYTRTNATLTMSDKPAWQSGPRSGRGDRMLVNTLLDELVVRGNASLQLPASQLAGQRQPASAASTVKHATAVFTNQFAEIFCEQYVLRPDFSVFRGGVYATHPEMNWTCEQLTVQVAQAGVTNIIAEEKVVFDLMTPRGKAHGTGNRALYSFGAIDTKTNGVLALDELRLTGTPATLVSTNGNLRNPVIIWDRARDKVSLPGGDYRIEGYAKPIDTNIFLLPKKKLTK